MSKPFVRFSSELFIILLIFSLLLIFREREEERREGGARKEHQFVPLIYACISWFLYVPWPGIKPATLLYWDDALTTWATQLGPNFTDL